MRKNIKNDIKQQIIDMLEEWIKWKDIAYELCVSPSLVSRLKKEIKETYTKEVFEEKLFDVIYEDEWELEDIEEFREWKLLEEIIELKREEEKLLKKNQKLTDSKNLTNRQIRSINRKDNFYEELTGYFEKNINIDLYELAFL